MKATSGLKTVSILFIVIFVSVLSPAETFSTTVEEVAQELACTCGCGMLVSTCEGAMQCSLAKQINDKITQMINKGQTKAEIIQYFLNVHGERILAMPTKKGFNLFAWVLPFLAIVLGGGGLYLFLKRSLASRSNCVEGSVSPKRSHPVDKKYLDQLERELKDFDS